MSSNLSRGLQSKVDIAPIEDGKIRFSIDTARLFIDTASERVEITDVVKGLKYSEIIALESPLPKVYLSSDTHQILMYDAYEEGWVVYGGGSDNSPKILELENRIKELEEIVEKFDSAIKIINEKKS